MILPWIKQLITGEPHFIIGGKDRPYLLRWFLVPRNRLFNIYLHKFLRDDDDRALHDHPWWFISLILKGGYFERVEQTILKRGRFSLALRPATHRHRVILFTDVQGRKQPCWSLIITGPRSREWGFWCPQGFVHWKKFVAVDDHGNIGKGCDQ